MQLNQKYPLARLLQQFLVGPFHRIEQERAEFLQSPQANRLDVRVIICLISAAILLAVRNYYLHAGTVTTTMLWAAAFLPTELQHSTSQTIEQLADDRLYRLCCWAGGQCVAFFVLPAFIVKVVFRQRLADYGWKIRGSLRDWPLYLAMYLALAPFLIWFSTHAEFQSMYPFYQAPADEPLWPRMFIWQFCYALQFISLEFFFRGFLVHGVKHRFGVYSIFVAAVPYCMIHFQKPFPETLSSIFGGIILGFMSLKNQSIVLGAVLHIAIAVTMDVSAIVQR